jgi:hypothetical protein
MEVFFQLNKLWKMSKNRKKKRTYKETSVATEHARKCLWLQKPESVRSGSCHPTLQMSSTRERRLGDSTEMISCRVM